METSTSPCSLDITARRCLLLRLRAHADQNISSLTGSLKEDFTRLVNEVRERKGTIAYSCLFEEVRSIFGDITQVVPGTIGAYCAGCLIPVNFPDHRGCSILCSNAIQPPNLDTWKECAYLVIRATFNEFSFDFEIINPGGNPGYIFVQYTHIKDFPGFSAEEKSYLQHQGLTAARLMGYVNGEYIDLLSGFQPIESLPDRGRKPDQEETPLSKVWTPFLVILLIIIVIIALV